MKSVARPQTARELWANLTRVFPRFTDDVTADDLKNREDEGTASLHSVMGPFAQYFGADQSSFSERQLQELARLVNEAVRIDDDLENAMATCFLEHLRQIGGYKLLAPRLSREAKRRTRA